MPRRGGSESFTVTIALITIMGEKQTHVMLVKQTTVRTYPLATAEFGHQPPLTTEKQIGFVEFISGVKEKVKRGNYQKLQRGDLTVRPRLLNQRVSGPKPDSTEDPSCKRACCALNLTLWVKRPPAGVVSITHVHRLIHRVLSPQGWMGLVWCGSLERECQLKCRSRRLTVVQNYKVRSKIALVLFQNWTLIYLNKLNYQKLR
ncbi:hypothetical protein AVEN_42883-1 [Araneus ventricosus]|uniref:Uncharacterized protein n=1 Tax=Araneus ventricosus TaxID=182803 RepID=A0A4Y2AEV5_ARAVE|nr:hypothetical protein AVEN_42883-1 [Araneus ventricosus]